MPGPTAWVHASVDVPARQHDGERDTWRAATGWADEPAGAPECSRPVHHRESALRLLALRLGGDDGSTRARTHRDPGTDDLGAEVARVQALGTRVLWPGEGFVAPADPAGPPSGGTRDDPGR